MNGLYDTILNMTLTGSAVILVVLIFRLFMKNMPKKYLYFIWGIVAVRLLCPFSIESSLSIFNIIPIEESVEAIKELPSPAVAVPVNEGISPSNGISFTDFLPAVWLFVAAVFILLVVFKYIRCKRELRTASKIGPGLYVGSMVDSPFVIGMVKPSIYLPAGLTEHEKEYLVMHEKMHIRRKDTWFKALAILILAVHWFNPLVWIAYRLFCRDMEMSCDEEVIAEMGDKIKKDYSRSLVTFAMKNNRPKFIVLPIAFNNSKQGGKEVKMRIKNILKYKGASKIIAVSAALLISAVGILCLFNGVSKAKGVANKDSAKDNTKVEETSGEGSKPYTESEEDIAKKKEETASKKPYTDNPREDKGVVNKPAGEPVKQPSEPYPGTKTGSREPYTENNDDIEKKKGETASKKPYTDNPREDEGVVNKPADEPVRQPSEPYPGTVGDSDERKAQAGSKTPFTETPAEAEKKSDAANQEPYTDLPEVESVEEPSGKDGDNEAYDLVIEEDMGGSADLETVIEK